MLSVPPHPPGVSVARIETAPDQLTIVRVLSWLSEAR